MDLTPFFRPEVPFRAAIKPLAPGRVICITGKSTEEPERFNINLLRGDNGDIGFHFDVRFSYGGSEREVVCNHCQDGDWGDEQIETHFTFDVHDTYRIIIKALSDRFLVTVDDKHFLEFMYRTKPLDDLDTLSIEGDTTLKMVCA